MKKKYYGYFIVFIIGGLLIYYSLWIYVKVIKNHLIIILNIIIQPFLKPNTYIDKFFPDKYWALAIPAYGASLTYSFSFIFLGWIFILSYKENNDQKEIKEQKTENDGHNKIE